MNELEQAAAQLARSERGVYCMRGLLAWIDDEALRLDDESRRAALVLLHATFGGRPMQAREAMRCEIAEADAVKSEERWRAERFGGEGRRRV